MNYFSARNNELMNKRVVDVSIFFENLNFMKVFPKDSEIENF